MIKKYFAIATTFLAMVGCNNDDILVEQTAGDYVSISSNQTTPKEIYCNEIEISYKNSNDDVIVNDIIIESQISTYPNPSRTGLFFFHSDYDIISIKVYDLNGSELLSNNNTSFLDLSSLTNGVYIARITTENNIHTEKLILNQ